jgi:hypothetical protein
MPAVRDVALAVATGSLALWLVSVAFTDAPLPRHDTAEEAHQDHPARLFDLDAQTARLRDAAVPAPSGGRNPFRFGPPSRTVELGVAARRTPRAPSAFVSGEAAPPEPVVPLVLIGVAEQAGPGEPRRTAVLSGLGQVFLVVAGDPIGSRYRVVSVGSDAVELRDEQAGRTHTLALRR